MVVPSISISLHEKAQPHKSVHSPFKTDSLSRAAFENFPREICGATKMQGFAHCVRVGSLSTLSYMQVAGSSLLNLL